MGGHPDVVVAGVVAGLVMLVSMSLLRAGRRSSAAVRVALSDPYPETRRAAVLVAARHGLATHAGLLVAHARQEGADEVLFTLAALVRDRGCPGRGSRAKLRRWSESFLSERETWGSGRAGKTARLSAAGRSPVPAHGVIDALQMFEAVTAVAPPPALAAGATEGSGRAPRWTAAPGALDPLVVLASLDGRPARIPSRSDDRGLEPGNGGDHEALVDRLAGIAQRHRSVARPRTGEASTAQTRHAFADSRRPSVVPSDRARGTSVSGSRGQEAATA